MSVGDRVRIVRDMFPELVGLEGIIEQFGWDDTVAYVKPDARAMGVWCSVSNLEPVDAEPEQGINADFPLALDTGDVAGDDGSMEKRCEATVVRDGQPGACDRPTDERGYCDRPSDHQEDQ